MNTQKIQSYLDLYDRHCVAKICMVEHFDEFMNSSVSDAFTFFCRKGMIQTEIISDVIICGHICDAMLNIDPGSMCLHDYMKMIIGYVMAATGAKLNPNHIKELFLTMNSLRK